MTACNSFNTTITNSWSFDNRITVFRLKDFFLIYMYHDGKEKRPNSNESNITIVTCSVCFEWTGFWQERNDLLDEYSSCCCWIHCISLPLSSFTTRIFVQFPITTLMFRLSGNVQNISEAVQCPRQPTSSTAPFIYSIPNHDQYYHHKCRGLPSLSQPIPPALFLLSERQLIVTDNLQASNRIIGILCLLDRASL